MDYEMLNSKLDKDFYDYLPSRACEALESLILAHYDKEWFAQAWIEYRDHVSSNEIEEIRMPGYIFNKYTQGELEHGFASEYYTEDDYISILGNDYQFIEHFGVGADDNPPGRGSGRYPKGSGKNPYQHETVGDFHAYVTRLEKEGMKDTEIAAGLGISTTKLRALKAMDGSDKRREMVAYAKKASEEGKSNVQIGKELGEKFNEDKSPIGESTVRSLLNGDRAARMNIAIETADQLKKIVDEKGTLDVGAGVELQIGITQTKLNEALEILKAEGYEVYASRLPQVTNKGRYTTVKVLAKPGVEHKEVYEWDQIGHISDYKSLDNGKTFIEAFKYPASMDSKRLMVRFEEEGGVAKDGLVEIRRGVKDLSLGESNYAQVRILVDGTHYIKGMAVYGNDEDFPDGVDVIFNTNKSKDGGKLGALKSVDKNLKKDPTNPFGSSIKEGFGPHGGQSYYVDENGELKLSLINKRADEGDWEQWSKEIPSQMLSKQPRKLIARQLALATESKENELDDILEVTNPTVRKQLLKEYADKCDRAAVDLKAAPFPGQKYQVILPLTSVKEDEIYAPNYKDGSQLALIRYPHGGTFEIPIVTVNNRNKEGKEYITNKAQDAVGISMITAQRLSGADFDGDTVMVIPLSDKVDIKSTPRLRGMYDKSGNYFDPSLAYGPDPKESYTDKNGKEHYLRNGVEYPLMTDTQREMGIISNLITDMTLKGATDDEKARAVKHSMVVIDAEKHHLDYRQSEIDNGIKELHKKYQLQVDPVTGREHKGAATLISRAKSDVRIPARKEGKYIALENGHELTEIDSKKKLYLDEKTGQIYTEKEKRTFNIDPQTGKKLYRNTDEMYYDVKYKDSNGKTKTARLYNKNGEQYYKNNEGKYVKVTSEKIIAKPVEITVTKMAETDDARTLSSGTVQEELYANYANKMKALANQARKEEYWTEEIPYSPAANKVYKEQDESLTAKLKDAKSNAPIERHAQMIANSQMKVVRQEHPEMTDEEDSKISTQKLTRARAALGAKRKEISITEKEWEAIQAGAISVNKLKEILKFCDKTRLKQLATPRRDKNQLSTNQIARLKSLSNRGYTNEEIAKALGISVTSVVKYLGGKE